MRLVIGGQVEQLLTMKWDSVAPFPFVLIVPRRPPKRPGETVPRKCLFLQVFRGRRRRDCDSASSQWGIYLFLACGGGVATWVLGWQ